ncbi:alpha/beta hydrolase [Agarilytica rhodophyticola]|uniref:alpha/beta hydrolase n=1 Tax=Agarilytica rhodophyticola TaxID=1737490 RepID=UPI000B345378|nr:alpha/beta hydrolase-fold protein [Agarilytica rhodophyticola]
MAVIRVEASNPEFSPNNTMYYTLHSSFLDGRSDVCIYNVLAEGSDVPIIFLLHGVYGSQWVWMHLGGVHHVYERLRHQGLGDFILVMPSDGGYKAGSAYLPIATSEGVKNYEAWIIEDVRASVIENVCNVSNKSKIYLCGLSMGGYGALRLGAKYVDLIHGISAHSAVTNLDDLAHFLDYSINVYIGQDHMETSIIHWLLSNSECLPPIRFDCGLSDRLIQSNINLSKKLTDEGISHIFEKNNGGHNWSYWHTNIAKTLCFFNRLHYG